jgi:hypothetical protein
MYMHKLIISSKLYTLLFIVITIIISSAITLINNFKISQCDGSGYSNEYYLAYCRNNNDVEKAFGDYEHGLFYYGLDGTSIANLVHADVIVLGNSRTQDAFNSHVLDEFFRARGLRYFLLGFAFAENYRFAQYLFERYSLHPKIVIINADPFFDNRSSPVWKRLEKGNFITYVTYLYKKEQQYIHAIICSNGGNEWLRKSMCGSSKTLYRSRYNGTWIRKGYRDYDLKRTVPIVINHVEPNYAREKTSRMLSNTTYFVDHLKSDKACLILTFVPSSIRRKNFSPDFAKVLASEIGAYYIFPITNGLYTFDTSHLSRESSEIWGRRFANDMIAVLNRCNSKKEVAN